MIPLQTLVQTAFTRQFDAPPTFIVRAPGRVNLIGEHTDYNDGFVLPMAIDRAVWIALRPRRDQEVHVRSLDFKHTAQFNLEEFERGEGWGEYVKGVAWALQEDGQNLRGWEGVVSGDVPRGSGLSSSAALELAIARAFAAASDLPWNPTAMAALCQKAENHWVGVNCGIMDQLISACGQEGQALLIDCRSLQTIAAPLPPQARIIVLHSAVPRNLAGSAYNQRRATCESAVRKLQSRWPHIQALRDVSAAMLAEANELLSPLELRRSRHVVSENERVWEAMAAMRSGDMGHLGKLMLASHVSLRDNYEVSSNELDLLVELAIRTPGIRGARLTGAGFGGCAIALADADAAEAAIPAIIEPYRAQTHRPGEAFVTQPGAGAEVWRVPPAAV